LGQGSATYTIEGNKVVITHACGVQELVMEGKNLRWINGPPFPIHFEKMK